MTQHLGPVCGNRISMKKEMKAKDEWATRYEALRAALADALGPNAPEIAAKVA